MYQVEVADSASSSTTSPMLAPSDRRYSRRRRAEAQGGGLHQGPLVTPVVQLAQAARQVGRARQPPRRVAVDARGDVLAQQLVGHVPLPPLRQRPAQVADHHLVQQHAQRVTRRPAW